MNKTEIIQYINTIEKELLSSKKHLFSLQRNWSSLFINEAGVYVLYDKGKIIYFGETGNIMGRMKDLKNTLNHSFRRNLGYALFNVKATSKKKFPEHIEAELNQYFLQNISISSIAVPIGRLEIEEYLVEKYEHHLHNIKRKRKGK